MNNLGALYDNDDFPKHNARTAYHWFLKATENGTNSVALMNVARALKNGRGVDPDFKKSAQYAVRAMATGDDAVATELADPETPWPKQFWREVQTLLKHDGYFAGATDGTPELATYEAIRKAIEHGRNNPQPQ